MVDQKKDDKGVNWNAVLLVGGIAAAGLGAWWLYDRYFSGDGNGGKSQEELWQEYLAHLDEMNYWVTEFENESQEMFALINQIADEQRPMTAEEQAWFETEEANMNEKTVKIQVEFDGMDDILPDLIDPPPPPNPWVQIIDDLGIGELIDFIKVTTMVAIGMTLVGFGVYVVTRVIKHVRDVKGPPPPSIPNIGGGAVTVTEPTLAATETKIVDVIKSDPYDQPGLNYVVGNMQMAYNTMPQYVQASVQSAAFQAALNDLYAEPYEMLGFNWAADWVAQCTGHPEWTPYIVAGCVVVGVGLAWATGGTSLVLVGV